jgi:hypothetical protein
MCPLPLRERACRNARQARLGEGYASTSAVRREYPSPNRVRGWVGDALFRKGRGRCIAQPDAKRPHLSRKGKGMAQAVRPYCWPRGEAGGHRARNDGRSRSGARRDGEFSWLLRVEADQILNQLRADPLVATIAERTVSAHFALQSRSYAACGVRRLRWHCILR